MNKNHRFPDFLCIGAQKAGTTWLYDNLKKHPDLGLPDVKELHYFDSRERILNHNLLRRLLRPHSVPFWLKKSLDEWRNPIFKKQIKSHLADGNLVKIISYLDDFYNLNNDRLYSDIFSSIPEKITGEITPDYSALNKDSVSHIYQIMPEVKIIFILRNPIDRAWSHARMDFSQENRNFASLCDRDFINHFNSRGSRKRSNYLKTLETWEFYYPEGQFLICFFDQLAKKPQQFIHRICKFLNIESYSDYMQQINTKATNSYAEDYKNKIPQELSVYLAKFYYPELEQLSARFGGYATQWLDSANKLLS